VPPAPHESQQPIVTLNEEDVKKMNVAQLKEELKKESLQSMVLRQHYNKDYWII
jgi:hypothetical protein